MRYKVICCYNGTGYSGSQRQLNSQTVQGQIERALAKIYSRPLTIQAASRTDKGVHALGQVFHYDVDTVIDSAKLVQVINRQLPDDIRILSAVPVTADWHARYDVSCKTYYYRLSTAEQYDVFQKDICYQYNQAFDKAKAGDLAKAFLGKHDFKAFMAAGSDKQNTIRTIYDINFDQQGDLLTMQISGDGFLYHMVRIMMGLFLDYVEGKKSSDDIIEQFTAGNRHYFRRTAPACGLYLANVRYKL
ncbi:MAG: tRNA pseudouridine(38-40) synthase TruA [Clostridiales bacterium]|nr:MAG: tRNA pseudouridine(38-40) synthase TruA [Clostridiales bacterium]